MMLTLRNNAGLRPMLKSGTALFATLLLWTSLSGMAIAQSDDQPLVTAPQTLPIQNLTVEDVEQLGRDLQATTEVGERARQAEQAAREATAEQRQEARSTLESFGDDLARVQSGSATGTAPRSQIIRAIDDNPGVGAVATAQGGLTSFSTNIPEPPPSPFSNAGPAVGSSNVFLEPDPFSNRQISPRVFEDPRLIDKAPQPREITRTARLPGMSLRGVDAKDLNLRTRSRQLARGLNCSPPDLRLEELDFPDMPNTYRLTGLIDTPTANYTYVTQETAQRNGFIRATGGPSLMSMTLSMKEPELGHHEPDGVVKINELVTVSPNALRLDVLVNNVIFRRAKLYYCRIPGTLD